MEERNSLTEKKESLLKGDFEIGGVWGDKIEWSGDNDFGSMSEKSIFRVMGFKSATILSKKSNIPKAGNTIVGEFEKSYIKFEIIEIDWQNNPQDMFFANVKPIDQRFKK